jgi:hypothetical protein
MDKEIIYTLIVFFVLGAIVIILGNFLFSIETERVKPSLFIVNKVGTDVLLRNDGQTTIQKGDIKFYDKKGFVLGTNIEDINPTKMGIVYVGETPPVRFSIKGESDTEYFDISEILSLGDVMVTSTTLIDSPTTTIPPILTKATSTSTTTLPLSVTTTTMPFLTTTSSTTTTLTGSTTSTSTTTSSTTTTLTGSTTSTSTTTLPSTTTTTVVMNTPTQIPVLIIKYFPLDGNGKIDRNIVGWDLHENDLDLNTLRAKVNTFTQQGIANLNEATRYKGYKTSNPPSLNFYLAAEKEYLEAIPVNSNKFTDKITYLNKENICNYVDNQGIRHIWVWMYHSDAAIPVESNMAMGNQIKSFWNYGTYGDVSNSGRQDDLPICDNTYVVYEFNYGRSVTEMLHNYGHHIESVLNWVENRDSTSIEEWDNLLFWGKFVGSGSNGASLKNPGCGWTHYPPNGVVDYDYKNPSFVSTDCEDWKPDGTGTKKQINCNTWTCNDDGGLTFNIWWMQNIPGKYNGLTYNGNQLRDWWDFIGDFDAAVHAGKSLTD